MAETGEVPAEIVKVAVAFLPELSVTLVGLTDQVLQLGHNGGGEVETEAVPLNPLRLVNVIVEVLVVPAMIWTFEGLADIAKSGATTVIGAHALVAPLLLASPLYTAFQENVPVELNTTGLEFGTALFVTVTTDTIVPGPVQTPLL